MKTAKGKQIESLMNNSLFCCEIPASKGMFRSIKVDANAPFSGVVVMVSRFLTVWLSPRQTFTTMIGFGLCSGNAITELKELILSIPKKN